MGKKNHEIMFLVSKEEKERLKKLAKLKGITLSEMIRQAFNPKNIYKDK